MPNLPPCIRQASRHPCKTLRNGPERVTIDLPSPLRSYPGKPETTPMRPHRLVALLALPLATISIARADDDSQNHPPKGFVALFDGKSLDGWHGMPHFDPRELAKLSADQRAKQIAEWTEDAKKHWSVQDGDLVNDGHGAYLTTNKEY